MLADGGAVKRRPPNPLGQAHTAFYSVLAERDVAMSNSSDSPSQDYAEDPSVFDEVVVGIFRSSHEGKYIYANRRLAELYGFESPEELIKAIGDIEVQLYVDSGQRDLFLNLIQSQGRIEQFESEIFRKDGSRIWISETAREVYDADGESLFYEGTIQEITEQKRAELELRRSEILFHSLVENLPQKIFRKDAAGKFLFANNGFCDELGKTRREIIGKTDFDFFPADLASKYREDDLGIIESGESLDTVEEHVAAGGEKAWVHVVKTPIHDEAGRCSGVQGIFWDVTQQKRTEMALAHERDLLRTLLDSIPDRIYFKDSDSRFLMISRALAKDFGLGSPEDAAGKTDADFFSVEHAKLALEDEQQILKTGRAIIGKTEKETWNDGRVGWVLTTKMPMKTPEGKIVGTVGISKDITLLKEAQEQLAHARDAALESAKVKAEFLANTSHEFRTPMNAIIGMTGLLLDTSLNDQQRDFLTTIRDSADALLEIINDILDFSKIEAKKLEIEKVPFDLRETVESTIDLLAERAQSKGLSLVCLVYQDVWTRVVGDPGRLRQILTNLVGNAIKFTEQGEVIVKVHSIRESVTRVELLIEIEDTGIGIPEETQARLFQPFTQADGSLTRRYGGTGLGLTISKQLSEMMGGEISLESKLGQGSTFRIGIPFQKDTSGDTITSQDELLTGLNVLIVDDNETNRQILNHQLRARRIKTAEAGSAAEAMSLLQQQASTENPFQVVILDRQMPEVAGLSLAKAIKDDLLFADVKIMLLTCMGQPVESDIWQQSGIDSCLIKPVKQSRLLYSIARMLTGEEAVATGPGASPVGPKTLRILVAEDNAVNQKVILLQLNKLGFNADAVTNGFEAVEGVRRIPYDVVLMDCHMPEMNGYEATRSIRQMSGRAQLTRIIAVTANADPDERRKYLDAGIDDYLIKPISLEKLSIALGAIVEEVGDAQSMAVASDAILEGLKTFGDASVISELIDLFLSDAPGKITQAGKAIDAGDVYETREAIHSLKGSARNLHAEALAKACEALEFTTKKGNLKLAADYLKNIEEELQKVITVLEEEKAKLSF